MVSILLRILQSIMSLTFKLDSRQAEIIKAIQVLDAKLDQVLDLLTPGPAVKFTFTAYLEDGTILNEVTKMDLRDDQKVSLTIQPIDKKGKPALIDGVPVWASSDETVVTVAASPDGLSAVASGVAPGTGRVVVTADGDLGTGVTDITGTLDFNVTGGGAVSVTITAGTPEDQ